MKNQTFTLIDTK